LGIFKNVKHGNFSLSLSLSLVAYTCANLQKRAVRGGACGGGVSATYKLEDKDKDEVEAAMAMIDRIPSH